MGFRYMYILYDVLLGCLLLLTLVASLYIKLLKVDNPYYSLKSVIKRSNVMIFIPVYSESKNELENTLESVVLNDYPTKSKIMFIVVDGNKKGKDNDDMTSNYARELLDVDINLLKDNENELYVGSYKYVKYILLIKGVNKGKKDSFISVIRTLMGSNKNKEISKSKEVKSDENKYKRWSDIIVENGVNINKVDYVLMLDTDTRIDASGLRYLVDYLDSNPFTSAVCGETTLTKSDSNILVMAQYYEYYITHYTLKAFETLYGDVLVLSGCFALYRRNILSNKYLLEEYESDDSGNLYKANLSQLGEDRLLTNLILRYYPDFNTKYIESAKCYTNVPMTFKTLLSQRRRWTNSLIFCNIMLLMNLPRYKIWKRISFFLVLVFELWIVLCMPLLLTIGYYYAVKFLIYDINDIAGLIQTVLFVSIPMLMCILLGKWRMLGYALIFMLVLPIFSIIIPLYSIYYSDDVSWGSTRKVEEMRETKGDRRVKDKRREYLEGEMNEFRRDRVDLEIVNVV
jgi:chitin synthase